MNLLLIYFIVGIVLGFIIGSIFFASGFIKTYLAGELKSIPGDEGKPYLFLDLDKRPDDIAKYRYVLFRVGFCDKNRSQK